MTACGEIGLVPFEKTGRHRLFREHWISGWINVFLRCSSYEMRRLAKAAKLEKQICRQYHRELRANPEDRENRAVFCDREGIVYQNTNERSVETDRN